MTCLRPLSAPAGGRTEFKGSLVYFGASCHDGAWV